MDLSVFDGLGGWEDGILVDTMLSQEAAEDIYSCVREQFRQAVDEEGRTYKSITAEYGAARSSISKCCTQCGVLNYAENALQAPKQKKNTTP